MGEQNAESEEKPAEIESEFILRLPPTPAATLRSILKQESKNQKDKLSIKIEQDMRHAVVKFQHWTFPAKIYDLPSTVDSFKTLDRKVFYKVASVCQIMVCEEEGFSDSADEGPRELDKDGRDKRYLYPHGVTPCLKNVRKRRFRKTMRKKFAEVPTVEKEVKILLKTDAEAISSRFELVDEKSNAKTSPTDVNETDVITVNGHEKVVDSRNLELGEYEIFGDVSSSSDESNELNIVDVNNDAGNVMSNLDVIAEDQEYLSQDVTECREVKQAFGSFEPPDESNASIMQLESKTAEQKLGEILKSQMSEEEKLELIERANNLAEAISKLQSKRAGLEVDIVCVENSALKERFLAQVEQLKAEERAKQKEYNEIIFNLQYD